MTDPFEPKKSLALAMVKVRKLQLFSIVYPEELMNISFADLAVKNPSPPKIIFLPSTELVRRMIKALVKFGDTETKQNFLLRFGLGED